MSRSKNTVLTVYVLVKTELSYHSLTDIVDDLTSIDISDMVGIGNKNQLLLIPNLMEIEGKPISIHLEDNHLIDLNYHVAQERINNFMEQYDKVVRDILSKVGFNNFSVYFGIVNYEY